MRLVCQWARLGRVSQLRVRSRSFFLKLAPLQVGRVQRLVSTPSRRRPGGVRVDCHVHVGVRVDGHVHVGRLESVSLHAAGVAGGVRLRLRLVRVWIEGGGHLLQAIDRDAYRLASLERHQSATVRRSFRQDRNDGDLSVAVVLPPLTARCCAVSTSSLWATSAGLYVLLQLSRCNSQLLPLLQLLMPLLLLQLSLLQLLLRGVRCHSLGVRGANRAPIGSRIRKQH